MDHVGDDKRYRKHIHVFQTHTRARAQTQFVVNSAVDLPVFPRWLNIELLVTINMSLVSIALLPARLAFGVTYTFGVPVLVRLVYVIFSFMTSIVISTREVE